MGGGGWAMGGGWGMGGWGVGDVYVCVCVCVCVCVGGGGGGGGMCILCDNGNTPISLNMWSYYEVFQYNSLGITATKR